MRAIERTRANRSGDKVRKGYRTQYALSLITILFAAFYLTSCDQSPIFYDISNETEPKDPIIEGSPSRMVMFDSKMWISNGTLYSFDGTSWAKEQSPNGTIRSLATAGSYLYALTIDGGSSTVTRLWRTADGANWTQLSLGAGASAYSFLESVYSAGPAGAETIFIGAHIPAGEDDLVSAYGVLYVNGTAIEAVGGMLDLNSTDAAGALVGAAHNGSGYYLATTMEGIFSSGTANAGYALVSGTEDDDYLLSGIIAVGTTVVAVGRGESILHGNAGGFTVASFSDSVFTGALATWDDTGDGISDLLLVGFDDDDDTYEFGYQEISLTAGSFPSSPALKDPGEGTPTTVTDDNQYESSLGLKAVNHLFQYVDATQRILFAATFSEGLWSYRDDEWNAEE